MLNLYLKYSPSINKGYDSMRQKQIIGVYKITNVLSGEFYIGASVNIKSRFSNHLNRDARRYYGKHRFYDDIINLGKENFKTEILEECNKDELLEREQYYYDLLKPTYNKVRPASNNFLHKEVHEKALRNSKTEEMNEKKKTLYNTPKYKELFRKMHTDKMKPVIMIKDDVEIKEFISMQEASRYITETTEYKGKNKTSKIKAVCDGERNSAYGFIWRYKEV